MISAMARAVVLPPSSIATTAASLAPLTRSLSPSFRPHLPYVQPSSCVLRSTFFSWEARSHLGSLSLPTLFISRDLEIIDNKRKAKRATEASLLGVGAPEALVIAVVALLVFGPKGLAEVARTLGKSLRAFQPTIRELQQISRDFKETLDQEIGLDELRETRPSQPVPKSDPEFIKNGSVEHRAYSAEDYLRVTQEQAMALVPEEQRKAAEADAWGGAPPIPVMVSEQVEISSDLTDEPGQDLPALKAEAEESQTSDSGRVQSDGQIEDPKGETRSDASNVQ